MMFNCRKYEKANVQSQKHLQKLQLDKGVNVKLENVALLLLIF